MNCQLNAGWVDFIFWILLWDLTCLLWIYSIGSLLLGIEEILLRAFHVNGGWVSPLSDPRKGSFSVRQSFIQSFLMKDIDGPRSSSFRKKRKSRSVRDRERRSNGIRTNHVKGSIFHFSSESEREGNRNPSSSHPRPTRRKNKECTSAEEDIIDGFSIKGFMSLEALQVGGDPGPHDTCLSILQPKVFWPHPLLVSRLMSSLTFQHTVESMLQNLSLFFSPEEESFIVHWLSIFFLMQNQAPDANIILLNEDLLKRTFT